MKTPMKQDWILSTSNFIHEIIDADLKAGKNDGAVVTRFPPEPNGYLHIGHAKSITLNFGTAAKYRGRCYLRFDDTNPAKEEDEYVQSIIEDVRWMVGHEDFPIFYASDYFQAMYDHALELIRLGKAYVDSCSADEINEMRGAPSQPGRESPWRGRSVEENLRLFDAMTRGELDEGAAVLRAKIDMASPNLNLRDPVMYRIKKAPHHRTGSRWVVYPMYDWAHGWEDSVEGITHSLCTLEFENHRPLYDWFLAQAPGVHRPRQIEFNRLSISYMVLSKRKLIELVREGHVDGWDDPRMPTICGLRRRGYTASAIRKFCEATGYTKTDGMVDMAMLEHFIREELNQSALRVMAILDPLKLVISNYPEGRSEEVDVENNPEDPSAGFRKVPFTREIWIEREDFEESPPKGYYRLAPGAEVRLKGAYFVKAESVVKDPSGRILEVRCVYDPASRGGESPDGRKVKGTIQWVSARHAVNLEARLYDHLFTLENLADAEDGKDYRDYINPTSLTVISQAWGEPSLKDAKTGPCYQFMRKGYFVLDAPSAKTGALVFNRTVTLKDSWSKLVKKGGA